MTYEEFLQTKQKKIIESGFAVNDSDLNENLFDFQRYAVKMDRYGIGFELKESYFKIAKENIKQAIAMKKTIFDYA